ncbi:MAG: hypothetical protein C4K49_09965 [Candidatus Thorarchaeota archaeon]|nr:MAG: hypothetical protein C4K49_09965 [Candidatus Thorarchaeota archaeon]
MNRHSLMGHLALASPLVLLMCFLVYPVADVLGQGLFSGTGTSFYDVVVSPVTQRTFTFTVIQAALSTALAVLLGLPGAFLIVRLRFRGKSVIRAAMIIPFVLPPIVVVVGFLQMFGAFGILDSLMMAITGSPVSVINLAAGLPGIVLAHAFYNIPLVVLMVSASLERLNPEVEESAELLGASHFQNLRRIVLPHIIPSLLASAVLTYLFCFTSFPIVLALGQGSYMTLEARIWYAFRYFDYGEASSLALIQILVTLSLAYSYVRLGRMRQQGIAPTSSAKQVGLRDLNRVQVVLILAYLALLAFLVAGPIAAVVRSSIYDPLTRSYSLAGFENLLSAGTGGGLVPLVNSAFYATMSTLFAVALGIPLAFAHRGSKNPAASLASIMALLPLGVSAITLAYGLMRAIVVPLGLSSNPWPVIIVAQTIIGLPFSARSIEIALRSIDPALLDQADLLGASRLQKLFFVELPLLAPGILVGAAFAFAMAIGEMSATLFIALPQNVTLAVAIYQNLGVRKFVEAGAGALVLVVTCLVAFLTIDRMTSGSSGGTL